MSVVDGRSCTMIEVLREDRADLLGGNHDVVSTVMHAALPCACPRSLL
jgi:hypothetical protein